MNLVEIRKAVRSITKDWQGESEDTLLPMDNALLDLYINWAAEDVVLDLVEYMPEDFLAYEDISLIANRSNYDLRVRELLTEHVTNGTFEHWLSATDAGDWTESLFGDSTINRESSEVYSGDRSLKFDIDASRSIVSETQAITLIPGNSYLLTVWYKDSQGSGTAIHVGLVDGANNVWLNEDGDWESIDTYDGGFTGSSTTAWTQLSVEFTAHASYTSYNLSVKNCAHFSGEHAGVASGQIYVDTLSITDVSPSRGDWISIWAMQRKVTDQGYELIPYAPIADRVDYVGETAEDPKGWFLKGTTIIFWPTPSTAKTNYARCWIVVPEAMSVVATGPVKIPRMAHKLIVLDAAILIAYMGDVNPKKTGNIIALYKLQKDRVIDSLTNRVQQQPQFLRPSIFSRTSGDRRDKAFYDKGSPFDR